MMKNRRLKEIGENVEQDTVNSERYIKELSKVCRVMFRVFGAVFEQEHLRFINMFAATGTGGATAGNFKYTKGIMEHKIIQKLRAASGDKSLFKHWHQKFTAALGQVGGSHEKIAHRLVKEIDLGNEMEKVATGLRADCGDDFEKASGGVCKAEMEADDKIKMVPTGQGVSTSGVMYRRFTDVSGLGLAEQVRRLMHPDPPKREEEPAEHVEMWQDKMRRLEAD
jgi:hypothetical protein